jgi:MFS family permease
MVHLLRNKLSELYLNFAILSFTFSLVGVFVPIYLLDIGYELSIVLIYLVLHFAALGFFSPVAAKLANRIGFKHMILYLRIPLMILWLFLLQIIPEFGTPIILIAGIVSGIGSALYWIPTNSMFMRYSDHMNRAKEVSQFKLFGAVPSVVGPAIGGLIIVYMGFSILFVIAIIIGFLSVIPLFRTPDTKPHVQFSHMKLFSHKNNRYHLMFLVDGFKTVGLAVFWPIFIFLTLNNIADVGFTNSLVSAGLLAFAFMHTSMLPKIRKHTFLKMGGLISAILWIMVIFSQSVVNLLLISFLLGFFVTMIDANFEALSINKAKHLKNKDEFIVMREIMLNLGRIIALAAAFCFVQIFNAAFSFASLGSLAFVFF